MRFISSTIITISLLALFLVPMLLNGDPSVALAQSGGGEEEAGQLARWTIIPLLQSIGAFLITLGAFIMWMCGVLLNYAIQFGIVDFAQFANISGIPTAWAVLRDVTNMAFIFIFLAIGISTILGVQRYSVGRLLPKLLIVAVLVNFSLFATKAVIDVAHTFAGAILNQSGVVENQCEEIDTAGVADCALTHGVSAAFIEQFGFVNFFGASAEVALGAGAQQQGVYSSIFSGDTWGEAWKAVLFGLFSFIFMSLAGIIFLAGAVILIMRIVTLLLLMIASAPAFAAAILPDTEKYFNQWLNTLLKEAFFAPILLLLFAISLLFLNTARGTAGVGPDSNASFAAIFIDGGIDSVNLIVILLIGLGFLFMSLQVAKELGATGAGTAMKVRNWGTRRVAAATAGGAAIVGRNTIGATGAGIASAIRSNNRFGRSTLGRLSAQTFDSVGAASFDARAYGDKNVVGKAGKGYTGRIEDRKKTEQKYAKSLENTLEEKAVLAGLSDKKKALEKEKEEAGNKKGLEDELATLQNAAPEEISEAERVFMSDEQRAAHDAEVAAHASKVKDLQDKINAIRDEKTIKKELDDIKKQETTIKNRPKEKYARKLEREPWIRGRADEVTEASRPIATRIVDSQDRKDKSIDEISKLDAQIKYTRDKAERTRLIKLRDDKRAELRAAKQDLRDAQGDQTYASARGTYATPTGDIVAGDEDAAGKLAGAAAIRKEINKDEATKNRDALVEALKSESGGDKKEDKDA